jgi:hypothetical protein
VFTVRYELGFDIPEDDILLVKIYLKDVAAPTDSVSSLWYDNVTVNTLLSCSLKRRK